MPVDNVIDLPAKPGDAAGSRIDASLAESATAETVAAAAASAEELELAELAMVPQPDDPYVAHSRPHSRSLRRLMLIKKDGTRSSFSYDDLRDIEDLPPERPGHGPRLALRFFGAADVELDSRHSDWLHGQIYLERLAWIREVPHGCVIKDDSAVVITGISIRRLRKA